MSIQKKSSKATVSPKGQPASRTPAIAWRAKPEAHDYPAAASYLALLVDEKLAAKLARKLKRAPMTSFKAKDIFRASGLSLLGVSNSHVRKNLLKIDAGEALSPLLLVRDHQHGKVVVADGYHRLCSVYTLDEDAAIPCKIV